MNHINKYLLKCKPYKLASHKIWSVSIKERTKILKLDWNESTLPPSPNVKKRLTDLIEDETFFNLYPSTCNSVLLEKLSYYINLPIENIQYFSSSDGLQEYIAKLYITVGSSVVLIWPTYDNLRLTIETSGGIIHYFDFNNDFSFDNSLFVSFLDENKPSFVYICNPNNPTGYLHKTSFIESLLIKYPETMFLVDEAYYEFTGKDDSCVNLVRKYDNLLVTRTMSKAFGLANFRFGYLLAHESNIKYISVIRNPKNIPTITQEAAIAALDDIPYMKNYVSLVTEAKQYFINELLQFLWIKAFDSFGNFVLLMIDSFEIKMQLIDFLEKNNIFIRNLSQSPMLRSCVRCSIGTKKQMEKVVMAFDLFERTFLNGK
ncbi:MAG: histidinol-phosphate transaminase [Clostridia bacterium]|nr:histidinol-phosphate transaminase [Clostridia bacterium]